MPKYGLSIFWSDEDEAYVATCLDFPGLSAFGDTPQEALAEGMLVLEAFKKTLRATGKPLPEATQMAEYSGQTRIRMPKNLHRNLAQRADAEGVSLNTWIVTLLAEANASAQVLREVQKVSNKIDKLQNAHNIHIAEANAIRIQRSTYYNPEIKQGGEYGQITSNTVKWTSALPM